MTTTPFGSWPSEISAESLVEGVVALSGLASDGDRLCWLEGRPQEGGRTVLMARTKSGSTELTPAPFNVRSRVHEYGGGALTIADGQIWFVNFADQNIYHIAESGEIEQLTDSTSGTRFADFVLDASRNRLISVVEIHHEDKEPTNSIGAVDLDTGALSILAEGHDFYAAPRLSPNGERLAFIAWDHPNMPWDGTVLTVADVDGPGALGDLHAVAGGIAESVLQPVWQTDEALLFISDANGFWNLYRFDLSGIYCVLEDGTDYAAPPWAFAMRSYAVIDSEYVVISRQGERAEELIMVNARTTMGTPFSNDDARWLSYGSPLVVTGDLYFIGRYADQTPTIERLPLSGEAATTLCSAGGPALASNTLSRGEAIRFSTRDSQTAHAYFYAPTNPLCQGPERDRPPLLVLSHGGPTSATDPSLSLGIQYYTSRGWAVLDVNYRGSSGYGRDYRCALNGAWGILDVTDCEDGVRFLADSGRIDPERVAIRGGSAGGYTTLAALTTTHTFKAGASHYGIGDLSALARDTHKFESRYLDVLLGEESALVDRSPIQHLDRFNCPVIFFQGSEDKVVPPNQSQAMADALKSKGIPVAYLEFAGEGHGFRDAANIIRTAQSEYAFFCRVFHIEPAESLPDVSIDNMDKL